MNTGGNSLWFEKYLCSYPRFMLLLYCHTLKISTYRFVFWFYLVKNEK